ncbi:hypothetical protein EDC01DRAFT_662695 [Geopyxis carbonaria]|nr:hypothetical protein EDC01DRAFT_662695 [Geopyxis carbonaria]
MAVLRVVRTVQRGLACPISCRLITTVSHARPSTRFHQNTVNQSRHRGTGISHLDIPYLDTGHCYLNPRSSMEMNPLVG